jgi:hypothetical protein
MAIKEDRSDATVAKSPSGRVRRTPVGVRNVLTVRGKDPAYEYRIVNDTGDRVEQFKGAGYDVVMASDVVVGDRRVNKASAEGSVAQVAVGGGDKAVVMRIKKEWYDEDQARKQHFVNETEASTKTEALKGNYGKLDIGRD